MNAVAVPGWKAAALSRKRRGSVAEQLLDRSIPVPFSGCWIWLLSCTHDGYCRIQVGAKKILAHRLSYETFVGTIPDGQLVMHKCDTPPCINPDHLFLGTDGDNTKDKIAKGRHAHGPNHAAWSRGQKQHMSKLTDNDVREILADERSQQAIANDYGVTQTNISFIKRRATWKHVT